VIFGAGMVGRGFLGQLFTESGYEVAFVDIDCELVQAINARGGYRLRLVDNEATQDLWIAPARAIDVKDEDRALTALIHAELVATAVGARALSAIAPVLASAIARRAEVGPKSPCNVIVCENLKDADKILREMVQRNLDLCYHPHLERRVGFVMAVIGRMAALTPSQGRREEPALVTAEPYKELPVSRQGFVGAIPEIVGLRAEPRFEAWVARKLYLHNAGHAMLAYLGYLRGLVYGYEALRDAYVRPFLDQALDESLRALAAEFEFSEVQLRDHVADLIRRFDNQPLGDTIFRLARDPLRKLGPEDRLVGSARLAFQHGIVPRGLAWGIAAGLLYDDPRDSRAAELQRLLSTEGTISALRSICGLDSGVQWSAQLAELVLARYAALKQGAFHL
jgi:mannitol-1-phosphate 5-dehydrogenase